MKRILFTIAIAIAMCGCAKMFSVPRYSKFATDPVTLGTGRTEFVAHYGAPYDLETFRDENGALCEQLYYKERLYTGSTYYVVTTVFRFVESKLVEQRIGREDRKQSECTCETDK